MDGAVAAPPATLTPLPLLKPSKLWCITKTQSAISFKASVLRPCDFACIQPVLQSLVDVVVPSAGVRVLGGVWSLLNLCEYNEIVLGGIEPAHSTSCQRRHSCSTLSDFVKSCRPTHQCSYMEQGVRLVLAVHRPCSDLGTK